MNKNSIKNYLHGVNIFSQKIICQILKKKLNF